MQNKIKEGNLVQKAYDVILQMIITLQFQPGEFLIEKDLEERLGFGRTPIREAILLLKEDNLVEREPHKSCYVKEIGPNDIKDLFESLMVVEKNLNCFAAELATPQELTRIEDACAAVDKAIAGDSQWAISAANIEFHNQICLASRNRFLFRCHQRIRKHAERLSHLAYRREDQRNNSILHIHNREVSKQHNDLVRSLKKRDRARVEAVSMKHIRYFQNAVIRFIQDVRYG